MSKPKAWVCHDGLGWPVWLHMVIKAQALVVSLWSSPTVSRLNIRVVSYPQIPQSYPQKRLGPLYSKYLLFTPMQRLQQTNSTDFYGAHRSLNWSSVEVPGSAELTQSQLQEQLEWSVVAEHELQAEGWISVSWAVLAMQEFISPGEMPGELIKLGRFFMVLGHSDFWVFNTWFL